MITWFFIKLKRFISFYVIINKKLSFLETPTILEVNVYLNILIGGGIKHFDRSVIFMIFPSIKYTN